MFYPATDWSARYLFSHWLRLTEFLCPPSFPASIPTPSHLGDRTRLQPLQSPLPKPLPCWTPVSPAAPPAKQRMGAGEGAQLPLCFLALLALPSTRPVTVEDTHVQLDFFQESFPSKKMSGEFLQEFNEEELFHVDWEGKETVWRLPDFKTFVSFDAQNALGNLAVMKNNLEIVMKRSNWTQAPNVPPVATVYPENPVDLGDPNVLICFVDQFSPPMLNITWLKNGEEVSEGVTETDFYPGKDYTFRKFSYLPFIPESGDFYVCKVDHWGLAESLKKLWDCKEPIRLPETTENVVCALGLALGILGIIAGTALCFKARQGDEGSRRRGTR